MSTFDTSAAAQARDREDPLRGFRDRFVVADPELVYLDGNSLGRMPVAVRAALRSAMDAQWGDELISAWTHWQDLPRRAGDVIADGVVQAKPGEIIVADSTTVNLYKLAAAALAARPGRRVIVTDVKDFPSDEYVLQGLAATGEHIVRTVDSDLDAGPTVAQVHAAVGPDTALVVLSHVSYRSGALADMVEITRIAHEVGALVLWDLCHSAAAVPVPLSLADADLAVGCTYKYLNAGPGAPAFLYVRQDLQQRLRQPIWGWFGRAFQFDMDPTFEPASGIERFLTGTPSVFGCLAVLHGAGLVREAGVDRIYAKGQALTSYAVELADAWLATHGVRVASPRDPNRRGCHVTLHHPQAWQLCQALIARNVIPDYRNPDRLRLGFAPLYTRFIDVYRGLAELRDILNEQVHVGYPAAHGDVT